MFTKFENSTRTITILSLVFVLTISVAWATINTYSASKVIQNGGGNTLNIINEGANQIKAKIVSGSLDAYMAEESLNEVEITCELTEELVSDPNGDYYKLSFAFGPSGAYFDPDPLVLKIKGKWVANDTEFWLYDENGEEIAGTRYDSADMIKSEIDHLSCYYYEGYCY